MYYEDQNESFYIDYPTMGLLSFRQAQLPQHKIVQHRSRNGSEST